MEDMISKIVDMDKKARDLTNEAKQSKIDYEKQVLEKKEKIKTDFLERAKERVKINKQTAQKKADEELAQIKMKNAAIIETLDRTYAEHKDEWVSEITARAVG